MDFSSAFNKINQDTLLMIMYDLGFPTDALEVVKDLYTRATTTFQTPYGPTNPINKEFVEFRKNPLLYGTLGFSRPPKTHFVSP